MNEFKNRLIRFGLKKMKKKQMKTELYLFIKEGREDLEELMVSGLADDQDRGLYNMFLNVENWLNGVY